MQAPTFSEFELLLLHSENEVGTSVLLILAWIAACDGTLDEAEAKRLSEISVASKHGHDIRLLINLAKTRNRDAIQLACEVIKPQFHGEKANLFLEMAIGISIVDGYLLATENHILRFLADLLGVTRSGLNDLFVESTGTEIPEPSDPSKASYWQARERSQQRQQSDSSSGSSQRTKVPPPRDQKGINSYAVLGLEFGASTEEIKRAYRRLAQVHHPDKFSSLGEVSVAAATSTFRRIKEAYDYLVSYA